MLMNIKGVSNAKSLLQISEGIPSANSSWPTQVTEPTSQSRGEEIHLLVRETPKSQGKEHREKNR